MIVSCQFPLNCLTINTVNAFESITQSCRKHLKVKIFDVVILRYIGLNFSFKFVGGANGAWE